MIDNAPSVLTRFEDTLNFHHYAPVPDSYWLGVADIRGSTQAVANGQYKLVNMVGAGVIAAVINLLRGQQASFLLGGDGAAFLIPPMMEQAARDCLAATAAWSERAYGLTLRVAMIPVADIRAAGQDLRQADFSPSPYVQYAMFSGGGLDWADRAMKAGHYLVPANPLAPEPDLQGLSCRWAPIPNRQGCILSVIVKPRDTNNQEEFQDIFIELTNIIKMLNREGHPVPEDGPPLAWPKQGIDLEHRIANRPKWKINLEMGVAWLVLRNNWNVGSFSSSHYKNTVSINSDFRKYGDGLYLTLDCPMAMVEKIEHCLEQASQHGIIDYGLHAQESALMTCVVPRPHQDDHFHFIDGAQGGYTQAAIMMKKRRQSA